jgi:hypothetical protein
LTVSIVCSGTGGVADSTLDLPIRAATPAGRDSASNSVRAIHGAVLEASGGELEDDATAVCLPAG